MCVPEFQARYIKSTITTKQMKYEDWSKQDRK